MNAIQPKAFSQPRQLDPMSTRLLSTQADSIRDLSVALGDLQQAQADANGIYSASLGGRDSIRYTKDAKGEVTSVEINADTATPTRFNFATEQWPHVTTVTVGAYTYDVEKGDHVSWGNPGERLQLETPLADLLKGNGYTTRDLALALDNTSLDKTPGIGWVQVGEGYSTPLSFRYDRDGKVSELATNEGDFSRAEYSFFQGDLGSVAQRNSSYITKDNNVFEFYEGRNQAYRYAAWTEKNPVGQH